MAKKDKKKDKKKVEEVVEETATEEVVNGTLNEVEVVEETATEEVEETKVEATPDNDENNGEGVSTKTVATKAKKSKDGEVKFRSSGHTKLYAKLDPESRYAKNMVRRYSK